MPKVDLLTPDEPLTTEGKITPAWYKYFDQLQARIGGATQYNLGGTLTVDTTAVGNVGSGEDDLITYDLKKNTIGATSDRLVIKAFGTFAANANNKTVKLYLGSTELFTTGAIGANDKHWCIESEIIRTAAATQEVTTNCFTDTSLVGEISKYVSGTEDFTTQLTIKCTGEATSDDDIIQKGLTINLYPRG